MHWSCPITGESKWDRVSTLACGDGNLAGVVHWSDLLDLSKVVWMLIMLDPTGVVQRSIVSDTLEIFVGLGPSMLAAAECSCSLFRSCLVAIHVDVGSGYEGCWARICSPSTLAPDSALLGTNRCWTPCSVGAAVDSVECFP